MTVLSLNFLKVSRLKVFFVFFSSIISPNHMISTQVGFFECSLQHLFLENYSHSGVFMLLIDLKIPKDRSFSFSCKFQGIPLK